MTNKTVKELREIAKDCGIKNRWKMTKEQLIAAIEETTYEAKENENVKAVAESSPEAENCTRIDSTTGKDKYLKNIEEGVLVAYSSTAGIMKSAKVVRISQKNKKLKVIDFFGNPDVIDFSQVAWVKTGKRWPKNIYSLIKRGTWFENVSRSR